MFTKILRSLFTDFSRIVRVLDRRDRVAASGLFGCMVVQAFLELSFIVTLTWMGTVLTDPEGVRANPVFRGLFFCFPGLEEWTRDPRSLLLPAGMIVVAASLLKNSIGYVAAKSTALFGEHISIKIGAEIMCRFLHRDYTWHLSPESGLTFQRMMWRSHLASMLINLLSMYASALTVLVLFVSLAGREPILTGMVLGIVCGVGVFLYRSLRLGVDKQAGEAARSAQEETRALLCATRGIREVLMYRQQKVFWQAVVDAAQKGAWPRSFTAVAPTIPTWVLEATGFAVVVAAVAYLVCVEQASMPRIAEAMALLMLTAWRVLPYANRAVSHQVHIRSMRPMAAEVLTLLEQMRAVPGEPAPEPAREFRFEREITLRRVSFRYPTGDKDCLHAISLTIPAGKKVGIIGPSGGGKSTLAGVLSGLLRPDSGDVLVDGKVLDPSRAAAFSRLIGYVPQTPFLFEGTLAENVAFSEWGKPWDEARVREACRKAAVDFADTHPKGLDLPIGENGAGLSGGQAQRVSIARALYGNPRLLIFDEATSALDQANENAIRKTIMDLADEITCVIIAHRLTTVEACDRLIWLDKGRIVMQGETIEILTEYKKHTW